MRATVVALLFLLAGCRGAQESRAPDLIHPPLDAFEAEVQQQLMDERARLDAALQSPASNTEAAEAYGRLGMHYHAYRMFEAAAACYRNAERLAPREARWSYFAGVALEDAGQPGPAAEALQRAVELDLENTAARLRLGRVLLELDRLDEADARFAEALQRDPDDAAALVGRARAALRRDRAAEALTSLQRALEIAPASNSIHYHLALAYRAAGDLERAERHLELQGPIQVALHDPAMEQVRNLVTGSRALRDRAVTLARSGRMGEAIALLQRSIAASPSDATGPYYLGVAFLKHGRPQDAAAAFRRALELDPHLDRAQFFLGSVLAQSGEDDRAVSHFERALELHSGLTAARFELAKTLQRLGRHDEAALRYEQVLRAAPGNREARLGRQFALIASGRWQPATAAARGDVESFPEEPAYAHVLARLLAAAPDDEVRDGNESLLISEELARTMRNADLAQTRAMALAEVGRFDEAREWQRAAIDVARRAGRDTLVERMAKRMALYESREPCRQPWLAGDPIFSPAPGNISGELTASTEDGSDG
ncbi:MAG: tetratricopeptide repeat protein [bacterium]|nr:tetratricopeptide repeat protein [bacterium]